MKIWRYIAIPAIAFVVGLLIFFRVINQGSETLTMEMSEATLPVVYMTADGERINELHGYTEEMDASSMRGTITPVEDGSLTVSIDTYGEKIRSIRYEVRSLDTTRLVQQSEAESLIEENDVVTAELPIQNLLAEQTEYLLILEVTGSGDPCYFYTRIMEADESDIGECISFVRSFHEITMSKTRQNELTDYMETRAGADNETLQTVTLHNSLSQMCWGNLRGTQETEPMVSVMEINDTGSVLLLTYIFSATDERDVTEYYNVEEYYRVRKGEERMYLLDYERTVEQIFRGTGTGQSSAELMLGIRSLDVEFSSNEAGTVVSFVQDGELWNCSTASGTLTRIFSFRTPDEIDVRENYDEHDIRILRTAENGNVDFVVYGYMNRGEHEGQVGISVCHFESATNTVEELIFLPSAESYQELRAGIGQEMYLAESGLFYMVIGDQVYRVDPDSKKASVLISDVTEGNYAASEDGRYLAWTEGDVTETTTMHMIDLETGQTGEIEASDGYLIRPLGFLDTDCVYGIVWKWDVSADATFFPLSRVTVVDFSDPDLPVLKTYEAEDTYVTGVEVRDGNIYLEQMVYENGQFVEAREDVIYNREMQEQSPVSVTTTYSEVREREVALRLTDLLPEEPERLESKWIREESEQLRLLDEVEGKEYYVYERGRVILATDYLAEAVAGADEHAGVVIGPDRTYLWNKARPALASVEYPLAEGEEPAGETYDLTGCTLDEVLYYVGTGVPVYGVQNGRTVVITGYDGSSVSFYDPQTGETTTETISDAAEIFSAAGNAFTVTLAE